MREDLPVTYEAKTDVGVRRSHNQDALDVKLAPTKDAWRAKGHVFIVADGMGAHAVGEKASLIAVETIRHSYTKARGAAVADALKRAIVEANEKIHTTGRHNKEFEGMGTTATALVLCPAGAYLGHVGDSRCYRIRSDLIEQLTFDHSLVWEVARKNNVLPEEIKTVPKNIIVRSLGPEAEVNVDLSGPYKVRDGDRYLLCTDGLSGQVSEREIWSVVSYLPPDEACEFLVDLANYRGGIDNVSLILVQVGDPAHPVPRRWSPLRWLRRQAITIYQRTPARYGMLAAGALLCGLAVGMKQQAIPGFLYPAIPGAALLVAGFAWLAYLSYRHRREPEPPPPPPPPIHRSYQCSLAPAMVEKLAKNESVLRETAQEQGWKVDWDRLATRRTLAEQHLAAGDIAGGFREYCRSLGLLFAGMRQARNKQEIFDPHFQTDFS